MAKRKNKNKNINQKPLETIMEVPEELDDEEAVESASVETAPVEQPAPVEPVPDYAQKHSELMIDEELASKSKEDISKILRDSGITDEDRIETMAKYSLELVDEMPAVLEQNTMNDLTLYIFDQAYETLEGSRWDAVSRVKAAQSITNVLMQNYSPVAFANGKMDEYAKDYVFERRTALASWLSNQDFNKDEIDSIMNGATGKALTEDEKAALDPQEEEKVEEAPAIDEKAAIKNQQLKQPVTINVFVNNANLKLHEKCSARLKDTQVLVGARNQVTRIINPSRSRNRDIVGIVNQANRIPANILDWYESTEASRLDLESPEGMQEMTKYVFGEAFSALSNTNDLADRVMMAQEITNVMMENFSNAAFLPEEFAAYADNYMVINPDVLKDQLSDQVNELSDQDFTRMMDKVNRVMADKLKATEEREKERQYNKDLLEAQKFDRIRRGVEVPADESVSIEVLQGYKQKCKDNIQNPDLTINVKAQMANILINAGVNDTTVNIAVDKTFNTLTSDIEAFYDDLAEYPEHLKNPGAMMDITNQIMVNFSTSCVSEYIPNKAERLVAGQEIADVIFRCYSPVAFTNGNLDKYANYYIVNSPERVYNVLNMNVIDKISREELPAFMKDVKKALNKERVNSAEQYIVREPKKEEPIKVEAEPEKTEEAKVEAEPVPDMSQEHADFLRDREAELQRLSQEASQRAQNVLEREQANEREEDLKRRAMFFAEETEKIQRDEAIREEAAANRRRELYLAEREAKANQNDQPEEEFKIDIEEPTEAELDDPALDREIERLQAEIDAEEREAHEQYLRNREEELQNLVSKQGIYPDLHEYQEPDNAELDDAELDKEIERLQAEIDAEERAEHEQFLNDREAELQSLLAKRGMYPEAHEYQHIDDAELDDPELDRELEKLQYEIDKEEAMAPENSVMFENKLKTFNNMYSTNVNANEFVGKVSGSWELLSDSDEQKVTQGKKELADLLKDTLKGAFEAEKNLSYSEQRLPEYSEIIKSANDLLRVSMFAFTDMYYNPDKAKLFIPTAFGGLREDELADLTKGDSFWNRDQRSNSSWEIQSKAAIDIAKEWLEEDKPYETMINEMNALVAAHEEKDKIVDEMDVYNKLAAAEWLLLNNEKMMIDDPEDPLNKMPNWGNRYWKSITNAREKLGIPKHISMRELIQGNYAEMAKAASNLTYNKTQIREQVLDPEQREKSDSMEKQKVEFTVQRRGLSAVNNNNEKQIQNLETDATRVQIYVKECDERLLVANEPKEYNFVPQRTAEFTLNGKSQEDKKEEVHKEETKNSAPEL